MARVPRDLGSASHVRQLFRKAEEQARAPAYLFAVPGLAWWLAYSYFRWVIRGMDHATGFGAGMIAAIPLLVLSFVAATFGVGALAMPRIGIGYRLLLFAVNVSGPFLMFASRP